MGEEGLPDRIIDRCKRIGEVDILVGILCKNVETTILHVLNVVNEGLYAFFPEYRKCIAVSVGESDDRTMEMAVLFQTYNSIGKIVTEDIGGRGKGAGIRTIMEIAKQLKAGVLVLVDGDLLSIRPKWIESIAGPIIYGRADLTVPFYIRDKYDGVITNILAYPFTRAVYGVDIRQPIAGEFGLSKELYERLLDHPLYPLDFGIDIFIVTAAAAERMVIKESLFTQKIHESTTRYLEPEKLLIPMFRQVTGKMFDLAKYYEDVWKNRPRYFHHERFRRGLTQKPIPVRIDLDNIIGSFREGYSRMRKIVHLYLPDELDRRLERASRDVSKFDADLWSKIVYNFSASYKLLEKDSDKFLLLEALKPLWLGRFASYAIEVKDMDVNSAEEVIQEQARIFEENFDYLLSIY
ncbi:MAG TPA: glycosyl transferase family 2 [Thermoplasmatales archaeon]|nr:glycosyl transferase family 2 [Thermoplasmatales archaeon]HEX17047.1 glycosyl transferase family 2 [Thermoplasmatales archaeon]